MLPHLVLDGGTPSNPGCYTGNPHPEPPSPLYQTAKWGTHPVRTWDGIPPHPDLGWGTPPCLNLGWGTPPPRKCEQTKNITFPHPSDAGGNDLKSKIKFFGVPSSFLGRQNSRISQHISSYIFYCFQSNFQILLN